MSDTGNDQIRSDNAAPILVAVAAMLGGYFPAAMAWDALMRTVRPVGHAEELMGRGIETMLIGGPLGAALLGVVAGLAARKFWPGLSVVAALGMVAAAVAVTLLIANTMPL